MIVPSPMLKKLPPTGDEPLLRADARRNRERILDAAHRAFAANGLEVSIDEIALEAEVGIGTVYRHFSTKEDLVAALMERHFARLTAWMAEALEREDVWEAFVEFMTRAGEMQAFDRGFISSVASRPEFADVCAAKCGLVELSEEFLERARQAGVIRPEITPPDIGMAVCAIGTAAAIESSGGRGSWRRTLEILLDGMRNPAAS